MLDAQVAPLRGMTETLFLAALPPSLGIDAALKAALNPSFGIMNQALIGGFAEMVSQGALGSISALGAIDVDRMVVYWFFAREGRRRTSRNSRGPAVAISAQSL